MTVQPAILPAEYTPLRDYQQKAVAFSRSVTGSLWDYGMGTGKTLAALEAVRQYSAMTILVVCPLSVIPAWRLQALRHGYTQYHVELLDTGSVARKRENAVAALERIARGQPVILVINYESLWRSPFADWAMTRTWDVLIADEVHRIKGPGGQASRYMHRLGRRAIRRIGLSGTPLAHSPMDAYAIYRFLDDRVFGTNFTNFRARYAVMGGYQIKNPITGKKQPVEVVGYQNMDEFRAKLNTIRIHASRDLLNLPPAVHIERPFALPPNARTMYRELEEDFYSAVDRHEITVGNALGKLLRLQQITSGFAPMHSMDDPDGAAVLRTLHDGKRRLLADIIEDLEPEEPLVVFCRFVPDLDAVAATCTETKATCCELSGRAKQLGEWQANEARVLAVQIGAGAEGIDLTRAAHAVFYSIGFSLYQYEQALARTHRPGQERTCFYHHLIAESTVDRKVYKALKAREDVIEAILQRKSA
jgi:SNF2 family DNA or RNA helicase